MTRILVTGGSGVIGREVVAQLSRAGTDVLSMDLRAPSEGALVRWERNHVEHLVQDVRDLDVVSREVERVDGVIHLAGNASILDFEDNAIGSFQNTFETTATITQAVQRASRCRVVVAASTAAVYEGQEPPFRESQRCVPIDFKALAKYAGEKLLQSLAANRAASVVVLRPFSVYAPDEFDKGARANVLSLLTWAVAGGERPVVWGDGAQTRDFVHVEDAARFFCRALDLTQPFTLANVCTGVATPFCELIRILGAMSGTPIDVVHVPRKLQIYANRLEGDPSHAATVLGMRTRVDVRAGLRDVWTAAIGLATHVLPASAHREWRAESSGR